MNPERPPRSQAQRVNGYVAAILVTAATIGVALILRDSLARSIYIAFAALTICGLATLIVIHVGGLFERTRDEAARRAAQLEDQAMEMQAQAEELEQQTEEAQTLNEELEEANELIRTSAAAQLAEAQSLARVGSWEWDIGRNAITWSDEMYRLYGLEPGDGIDFERYQSLIHPDDRPQSRETVNESLKTGESFTFHHRVVRPDGAERIFQARGKVIADGRGEPVRMIGTGQDVTDTRRAEAALRSASEYAAKQAAAEAAAQHLNRVLSQAPVVIAVLSGADHVFDLANAKGIEMLGNRELIGKPLREAIPSMAGSQYEKLIDMVYASGKPFVGREMHAVLDPEKGTGGYFNFVFQPLTNDEGVYAILIVANEVTDLVRSRVAAEEAKTEAIGANRAKSDFLARMSHELRTPLAAIMGYGELLADGITGPVNDEQKRQLGRIRSSANHLLSIIDEILTLARMEAGKEKVSVQSVELPDILESVSSMAEPIAAQKGLSFEFEKPSKLTFQTDPMKLRQVLLNLISNAVKYTEAGSVSLTSASADGHVHFYVKDTGVGVDEQHLEKIFEPFWQVEQTTTRRSGGTGLGLAVTRQFVDLLGGKISVESELGKGSVFQVSLPLQPVTDSGVAETLNV